MILQSCICAKISVNCLTLKRWLALLGKVAEPLNTWAGSARSSDSDFGWSKLLPTMGLCKSIVELNWASVYHTSKVMLRSSLGGLNDNPEEQECRANSAQD